MIIPSAADMLKSVTHTLENVIKPEATNTSTRSAAATVAHMLRIATLRIEVEGQVLHDEANRLRALLPRVQAYLGKSAMPPARDEFVYPSLAIMVAEVGALRQGVCDALDALQGRDLDAAGAALLGELHGYIAWQLQQEGKMIEPATVGHGPRR